MKKRTILITAGCVLLVGGLGFLGYREAMKRAWIRVNEYDIRSEGILQVGDKAPDLKLATVDGDTVMLSELHPESPLVLAFGSYT